LEDQRIQPLMKLLIEVQLDHAEQDRQTGAGGEPDSLQPARGHCAWAKHRQRQRHEDIDQHAQVETQAVAEAFEQGGQRGVSKQLAVEQQQCQAQQGQQRQQCERTASHEQQVVA